MTHEVVHIGLYVIFGIVLLPVYAMFLGWFLGKPRFFRVIAIALGIMLVFAVGIILGIVVLDTVLSAVVS